MTDCIFCKIANHELPAETVLENDHIIAFRDIQPQAPVHVLLIPKRHISSAYDISPADAQIIGEIHLAAKQVADDFDLKKDGYRLLTNIGTHGQQTVMHLHYHLLGGRQLQWPPG